MTAENTELSQYEEAVDKAINQVIGPYKDKLELSKGFDGGGAYWAIKPHNPKAAEIYVGGVDSITLSFSIDNKHWLEFLMKEKSWDKDIEEFKEYLEAFLEGKMIGWHEKLSTLPDHRGEKTALDVQVGSGKPTTWAGNILFVKKFKNGKNTVMKKYENY